MNSRHHGVDRTYLKIPCLVALAALVGAPSASAQGWQGSVTGGAGSYLREYTEEVVPLSVAECNALRAFNPLPVCLRIVDARIAWRWATTYEFGGEVLHTLGTPKLAAGVQGNFGLNSGYLGGVRGGPVAEFKPLSREKMIQPFGRVGYFPFLDPSQPGGTVIGGGLDVFSAGSAGLRLLVRDIVKTIHVNVNSLGSEGPIDSFVRHELSFHVGVTWR